MKKALVKNPPLAGSVAAGVIAVGTAVAYVAWRRAHRSRRERFQAMAVDASERLATTARKTGQDVGRRAMALASTAREQIGERAEELGGRASKVMARTLPKVAAAVPMSRVITGVAGLALLALSSNEQTMRGPSSGIAGIQLLERALRG